MYIIIYSPFIILPFPFSPFLGMKEPLSCTIVIKERKNRQNIRALFVRKNKKTSFTNCSLNGKGERAIMKGQQGFVINVNFMQTMYGII